MDAKTKQTARKERRLREQDAASRLRKAIDGPAILSTLQAVALGQAVATKEQMDALKFLTNKVIPNLPAPTAGEDDGPSRGAVFVLSWDGMPVPPMKRIEGVVMDETGVMHQVGHDA
jgi:hypothetical protein